MMDRGRNDQDDEIVRLLGKLRDTGPEYPERLYGPRRTAVLAGLVALQLGGAAAGLSLFAKLANLVKGMGIVEKIILGVEVAAVTSMTVYGATEAYIYRDQLKQLLLPPTAISSPFPSLSVPSAASETEAALTETATPTPSPTGSVTPTYFVTNQPNSNGTPPPPSTKEGPAPTKPGNRCGQDTKATSCPP